MWARQGTAGQGDSLENEAQAPQGPSVLLLPLQTPASLLRDTCSKAEPLLSGDFESFALIHSVLIYGVILDDFPHF